MVKSAQDVASDDAAAALNRSAMWSIFLQAEMGPCRVVMRSVFLQDAPKMGLAPHDHVVKTLTSDRADCALDISVLPWRSRRDRAIANAHRPNPPREHRAISAVVVADEKGRGRVTWIAPRMPHQSRRLKDLSMQRGRGATAFNRKIIDIAQRNVNSVFGLATSLAGAKKLTDIVELPLRF